MFLFCFLLSVGKKNKVESLNNSLFPLDCKQSLIIPSAKSSEVLYLPGTLITWLNNCNPDFKNLSFSASFFTLCLHLHPLGLWITQPPTPGHWSLFIFLFLGLHLWHVEVPGLGIESELQLQAYSIATAMPDLSCVCNLCSSVWQHQVHNPRSNAKDRSCILTLLCRFSTCWATTGTPSVLLTTTWTFILWVSKPSLDVVLSALWLDAGPRTKGKWSSYPPNHPQHRIARPSWWLREFAPRRVVITAKWPCNALGSAVGFLSDERTGQIWAPLWEAERF